MKKIILIISATILMFNVFADDNVEAKRLIENSQKKIALKNILLNLDLETFDSKGRSKSKSLIVSFAEFEQQKKVLVEFIAPENVLGTKILTTDYPNKQGIIEIYMPSTGKIQTIKSNKRNLKIMGSEIPISQFSTALETDYNFSFAGKELINEILCHKVKVENPDKKDYGIVFISIDDEHLLRVEKYDVRNKLLSLTELSDYIKIENSVNKVYPQKVKVKNYKTGKSSNLKVNNVTYLSRVDIEDFKLSPIASLIN